MALRGLGVQILLLLCVLPPGHSDCVQPQFRFGSLVVPEWCLKTSNHTVRGPVNACYEQRENTIPRCRDHAFILIQGSLRWCVDPRAWWLKQRLAKMEKRNICCEIF